jgi:hypothetical protein
MQSTEVAVMLVNTIIHNKTNASRLLHWAEKTGAFIDANGVIVLQGAYPEKCRNPQAKQQMGVEIQHGMIDVYLITDLPTINPADADSFINSLRNPVAKEETKVTAPAVVEVKLDPVLAENDKNKLAYEKQIELEVKPEQKQEKERLVVVDASVKDRGDELEQNFFSAGAMEDFIGTQLALTHDDAEAARTQPKRAQDQLAQELSEPVAVQGMDQFFTTTEGYDANAHQKADRGNLHGPVVDMQGKRRGKAGKK